MGRGYLLAASILGWTASAIAAPTLTVDELQSIAKRSPNVFDTFMRYRSLRETEHPIGYGEFNLLLADQRTISVDGVPQDVNVAGGFVSAGSMPFKFEGKRALGFGADLFSTNLTPEDSPMADGWGYRSILLHSTYSDQTREFSVSAGAYLTVVPVTTTINGERVFSRDRKDPDEAGYQSSTTRPEDVSGFIHVGVPWAGISTALLVDEKGIRQLKGTSNVAKLDLWESLGPTFTAFPDIELYQLGAAAKDLKPWRFPVGISFDVAGRYNHERQISSFDHGALAVRAQVWGDEAVTRLDEKGNHVPTGIRVHVQAHGSYMDWPGTRDSPWGAGGLIEVSSSAKILNGGFWRVAIGASDNYYHDIVQLPIPNNAGLRLELSVVAL